MSILRYTGWLLRQLITFAIVVRRPAVMVLVLLAALALALGLAVQFAAPVAIYPFI